MAVAFEAMEAQRSLKSVTVNKNNRCFRSFLQHLQSRGCERACDVTEADAIRYFRDKNGAVLRGYTAKRIISHALTLLAKNGFSECKRLSALIPLIKYHHKNTQFLTDDEIAKILHVLKDKEGNLSLRDRAIGFLLVYTGMRASDISSLRLEDIDWHNGKIHCIQQKTGVPLHLPLLPVIGNAIYDYLDKERPQSSCDYLFLNSFSAEGLAPVSICSISYVIYKASCVRNAKGDRKGTHIFRHHLVTALLSNGTDQPDSRSQQPRFIDTISACRHRKPSEMRSGYFAVSNPQGGLLTMKEHVSFMKEPMDHFVAFMEASDRWCNNYDENLHLFDLFLFF